MTAEAGAVPSGTRGDYSPRTERDISLIREVLSSCSGITAPSTGLATPISGMECMTSPRIGAQVLAAVPRLVGCQSSGALDIASTRTVQLIGSTPDLTAMAKAIHGTAGERLLLFGGTCCGYVSEGLLHKMSAETGESLEACQARYMGMFTT